MKRKWEEVWGTRAREFFLSFGDALFIVKDGTILDCNPKASDLFGLSCKEMKGKKYYQLCPMEEKAKNIFQSHFDEVAREGGKRFQAILSKRNGEKFFAEVTLHSITLKDGSPLFLVHVRDISQQKETERKLKESEETLREFVENAPIGIFRTTPEGKVIYANSKLMEIFGIDKEEDIRKINIREDIYQNPQDRDVLLALTLERERVENFHVHMKRIDGTPLLVSIYARAVRDEGGKIRYLEGAFLDLTEQKRLEEQLREIQRMEAIGTLVGGIAHEFNNILTGIIGYAELASLKIPSDNPALKDLENIEKGSRRAAELVKKLAAFGRRTILNLQRTDLNELVIQHLNIIKEIISDDIDLELNLDPNLAPAEADPEAVREVILSLSKNAAEAMPQGGTLTLETRPVTVGQELAQEYPWLEEATYAAIIVRDTGKGIDEKIMPHIFEPFFTTKGMGKGVGLGLSMVYGLAKQHRGAILVKSQRGKGSEFTFLLPLFQKTETQKEKREIAPPFSFSKRERVVLLVEDEGPVRNIIRETLEGGMCKVLETSTGAEALRIVKEKRWKIDFAIVDLILPETSGKEIGAEIQRLSPQTRVLYISGYSPGSLHPRYRPEEGTYFLQKPFTPKELLKKVGELMK